MRAADHAAALEAFAARAWRQSPRVGAPGRSLGCQIKASSGPNIQPEGAAVPERPTGQTPPSAAPNRQ
eukprot:9945915-Alexandrium_andersonii.AAC.1